MRRDSFGSRGEGWVIAQFGLGAVLLVATIFVPLGPPWLPVLLWARRMIGSALILAALWLLFRGVFDLGRNLTPNPKPLESGHLVQTGADSIVRHPIYTSIICGMCAIGLVLGSLVGLLSALILFVFFDLKSRREEQWLAEKYPIYAAYRRKTRKLIPFVY